MATYQPWPELPYEEFAPTAYLMHMITQVVGKLKLATPFEPQWANVPLWVTSRGLITGPIPNGAGTFTVDVDLIGHVLAVATSWGTTGGFSLGPSSVADAFARIMATLKETGVEATIETMPQEIANPIHFDQDTAPRPYDQALASAWWRILVSSHRVMQRYHARFEGKTPPIGLMWGTFDLRDARYTGPYLPPSAPNSGYIRRNAMNQAQIECGWWHGGSNHPKPAYYSFTFPQPAEIAQSTLKVGAWNGAMGEFILDYDDVRTARDPEAELYAFLESAYDERAKLADWDPALLGSGKPSEAG
jgi:hypothetical protein